MIADNTFDIITEIRNGNYDAELDLLSTEIRLRRQAQTRNKISEFQVGDRVKFNVSVRPRYLYGAKATIRKVNRVKVVVDLDSPHRRFHRNVSVPLSLIDKV